MMHYELSVLSTEYEHPVVKGQPLPQTVDSWNVGTYLEYQHNGLLKIIDPNEPTKLIHDRNWSYREPRGITLRYDDLTERFYPDSDDEERPIADLVWLVEQPVLVNQRWVDLERGNYNDTRLIARARTMSKAEPEAIFRVAHVRTYGYEKDDERGLKYFQNGVQFDKSQLIARADLALHPERFFVYELTLSAIKPNDTLWSMERVEKPTSYSSWHAAAYDSHGMGRGNKSDYRIYAIMDSLLINVSKDKHFRYTFEGKWVEQDVIIEMVKAIGERRARELGYIIPVNSYPAFSILQNHDVKRSDLTGVIDRVDRLHEDFAILAAYMPQSGDQTLRNRVVLAHIFLADAIHALRGD